MQELPKRLLSIDIIRAITMFLMIFVNDADGLKNIPEWIGHVSSGTDGLGFADTIFPAFLFIVGLSLPFAINNKLKKGETYTQILLYILIRSVALLVIGFFHVNLESYHPDAQLPKAIWAIAITFSFFLIWMDYPVSFQKKRKYLLMGTGILLLALMAALFKGGKPDEVATWMKPSWWGILGIIGWTYLVCAPLYLLSKGKLWAVIMFWLILAAINIAVHMDLISGSIWLIGDASSVTLTMGGIVISVIYAKLVLIGQTQRVWSLMAALGFGLIVLGFFIRPFAGGISKLQSTPAWVFICSGITILCFEAAVYLIDIKGKKDWFKWIAPAGTSTLTCYLMPYLLYAFMQLFQLHFPDVLQGGAPGVIRSFAVSFILIAFVGIMEKRHIKLKL